MSSKLECPIGQRLVSSGDDISLDRVVGSLRSHPRRNVTLPTPGASFAIQAKSGQARPEHARPGQAQAG